MTYIHSSVQSLSRVQLCDPMNSSTPGLPVLSYFPEFAQTHVHWISDAIQLIHPLSPPSPPALNLPQGQVLSPASGSQRIVVSVSAPVLPMNIQGWIFWMNWLVWFPCSPRDSQESSPAPQFESINSLALSLLYSSTLISVHDYWKNHSFVYIDLCWPSDVFAF